MNKEVEKIILDWSKKTGLKFCFTDKGIRVFPKLERKGAYVKELDDLDFDLPIVNKAIVDYLMCGVEPYETIENCNELKQFQKIVKISSNYLCGWHNDEFLDDKVFRVFASKNRKDTYIGKIKYEGATIEKFANTPEHCFIMNEEVNGLICDSRLDKKWYVDLANKRLKDFGVDVCNEFSLF